MGELKADLLREGMELRETHISQVFLGPTRVYKVKRPVALGYLDFSTLALRKGACDAEVLLNRRLAPEVYLGVVPITRDARGTHRLGGPGEPVEWAVEMRRMPDRDACDQRLADRRLGRSDVQALAEHLARFHAAARCDAETSHYGEVDVIMANVRENFEQTRESATRYVDRSELQRIEQWQCGFLLEQRERFVRRIERRCIRDGHGDLRLEHCYLDDAGNVRILDCIEFNERFRYGDVCADLAFLSMDLTWHERVDLSEALLAAYASAANDYDLYGVVDFYESYRAYVRGKVSSLLADDTSVDAPTRARAQVQARKYYLLAEACSREPIDRQVLYVVFGVIASGKSSVAEALAARVCAPVVSADRTRKFLFGAEPTTPFRDAAFAGHYDADASLRTYAEVLRRADLVLRSKRSVVLDASFAQRERRADAMAVAQRHGVECVFVECVVSAELCRERLAQRATSSSISDGRAEVFDAFVARFEPATELSPDSHVRLDTSRSAEDAVASLGERWI